MKQILQSVQNFLVSRSLTVRLASLWAIGVLLCLAAWSTGYVLFPEAFFRGLLPAPEFIPSHAPVASTMLSILLYNVILAAGLIVAANLFRVGWFPLGYLPVLAHWTLFGLLLGSNSFQISKGAKVAPSLTRLLTTTGFIEISAYTFIAAASVTLVVFRQESWLSLRTTRVRPWRQVRLPRCEMLTILVAVVLILLGAYRESLSILLAGG